MQAGVGEINEEVTGFSYDTELSPRVLIRNAAIFIVDISGRRCDLIFHLTGAKIVSQKKKKIFHNLDDYFKESHL